MAINDILNKIIDDAKSMQLKIIQENSETIKKLEKENSIKLDKIKTKFLSESKTKAINHARSIVIQSTNKNKNKLLVQKREIIHKIMSLALDTLNNDVSQKSLFIEKLMLQIKNSNFTDIDIITNQKDEKIINQIAQKILDNNIKASKIDNNIKGGFLVVADKTTIDMTFEGILNEKKSSIERSLASKLF